MVRLLAWFALSTRKDRGVSDAFCFLETLRCDCRETEIFGGGVLFSVGKICTRANFSKATYASCGVINASNTKSWSFAIGVVLS